MNSIQVPILIIVPLIVFTLLAIGACCFIMGYLLGSRSNIGVLDNITKSSFYNKNTKPNNQKVSIDETKIVTKINTDSLEKKYSSLGDTRTSQESISSSINKLKNMKG